MGTIKHIYKGILFIYDEDNPENYGYFVANSESCEIKKSTPIGNMVSAPYYFIHFVFVTGKGILFQLFTSVLQPRHTWKEGRLRTA